MKLVDPTTSPMAVEAHIALRLDTLEGKRIGLWSNKKVNAAELLDHVESELRRRHPIAEVVRGTFPMGRLVDPSEWGAADACDAIVLAIGDCGSCSTSGLMNQIALEGRGIPSMLIATDRFRSALDATRHIAGMDGLRWGEVQHPIGSIGTEELKERAREAVDQFCEIVVLEPDLSVGDVMAVTSAT